jgi:hypothetical protein
MACTAASHAFVKQRDGNLARGQPPSDSKTDDAGTDDHNTRLVADYRMNLHLAAPYAGMTQTGSTGLFSAAIAAPQAVQLHHREFCEAEQPLCACRRQARPDPRWGLQSQIEHTRPVAIIIAAPTNRLGAKPTCAIAMR